MRTYWVIALVCGLLLAGCGDTETVTSTEPTQAPAKKTTDEVSKQASEMVDTGTQLVKDSAADAKQTVEEVVATATKDVSAAAAAAEQKTAEIVDNSKQTVVEVKEQLQQEGTQLLNGLEKNSATSETSTNTLLPSVTAMAGSVTTPGKIATEVQASETLVIENKNGNVTLTHAEHGKLYGCVSCHSDTPPGPFKLGKDTAHAMCKGCHKELGGPTKCSGCHKK